jgi:hypothetical protein
MLPAVVGQIKKGFNVLSVKVLPGYSILCQVCTCGLRGDCSQVLVYWSTGRINRQQGHQARILGAKQTPASCGLLCHHALHAFVFLFCQSHIRSASVCWFWWLPLEHPTYSCCYIAGGFFFRSWRLSVRRVQFSVLPRVTSCDAVAAVVHR